MTKAEWYDAQARVHRDAMERHMAAGYIAAAEAAKEAMTTALENELNELVNRWYKVAGKYMRTDIFTGDEWMDEMPDDVEEASQEIEHKIETLQGEIEKLRGES